jgi:hypothetical protein
VTKDGLAVVSVILWRRPVQTFDKLEPFQRLGQERYDAKHHFQRPLEWIVTEQQTSGELELHEL